MICVKQFFLADRQGGIAFNNRDEHIIGHHALVFAYSARAKRIGCDIHQDGFRLDAADCCPLNGGAHGDNEIGADLMMRLYTHILLEHLTDKRSPRSAADEDDLVDRLRKKERVREAGVDGIHGLAKHWPDRLLVIITRDFHVKVVIPNYEFLPDTGKGPVRQCAFSLFHCNPETVGRPEVAFQVNPVLLLKAFGNIIYQQPVEVIPPEMGVAVAGFYFHDAVFHHYQGNIEGSPAQIVNKNPLVFLMSGFVGKGGSGRFIDNPYHIKTC